MKVSSSFWATGWRLLRATLLGRTQAAAAPAVPSAPLRRIPVRGAADPATQEAVFALKQVLDRHPRAREVFGHLALLEQGLRHLGARALQRMPAHTLQRAREQLACVSREEELMPLVDLLRRAGLPQDPDAAIPVPEDFTLSRFAPEVTEVTEADPAAYFEVMRAWQDTLVEEEEKVETRPEWHPTLPMPA